MERSIEQIFPPLPAHMVGDGFRVHNFIPSYPQLSMQRMNPFIMMDYNSKYVFPPSEAPKGVGVHPHKGFETVTIAYKGKVAHHDSSGNAGVIGEGDVQWMTAASGVLHKEYHEAEFSRRGGEFQMVQLWVNLPAKDKLSPPKYQSLSNTEIPKYEVPNEGGIIELIAGEMGDLDGRAFTFTPMYLHNAVLNRGAVVNLSYPANYNTALLVIEGKVLVNGKSVGTDHFVLFRNDGDEFELRASEDVKVLILSGEPIPEPIAAHGPFVMNTKKELLDAFYEFEAGKFGHLAD